MNIPFHSSSAREIESNIVESGNRHYPDDVYGTVASLRWIDDNEETLGRLADARFARAVQFTCSVSAPRGCDESHWLV